MMELMAEHWLSAEHTSGNAFVNIKAARRLSIASCMTARTIGHWLRSDSLVDPTANTSSVSTGQPACGMSKLGVFG